MNKQQSLAMLADANFSTLPLLSSIQEQGIKVDVCGNLLTAPCHAVADGSHQFDYSNKENLLEVVRDGNFSYLVPGCNDQSYLSCSWVADQCELPGYDTFETVLTLHHKDKFRGFAMSKGYPAPRVAYTIEQSKQLEYPLIVKPIDAFSGRGVRQVTHESQLADAIEHARDHSKNSRAIIEEFKTGSLHSHSAFIKAGEIVHDFFVDEYCTVYPYQVNSSCISSSLSPKLKIQIRDCMVQLAKELHLADGLLHTQLLSAGNNFWLIEITRRCPGDLYSRLIELSTGFKYAEAYVFPFLDKSLNNFHGAQEERHFARHTVSSDHIQSVFSVSHSLDIKHMEVIQLNTCGQIIKEAPFGKSGIVFMEFKNESDKAIKTPELKQHIQINSFNNLSSDTFNYV